MTIHNAPPVAYPLGRSYFLERALSGLWLAGLVLTLAWLFSLQRFDGRIASAFAVVLIAGVVARSAWRRPEGQLIWDGKDWRLDSAHAPSGTAEHDLYVIADFQSVLLLRIEDQRGASRWLCLERRASPDRWLDMRRAVYAVKRNPTGARWHDAPAAPSQPAVLVSQSSVHD